MNPLDPLCSAVDRILFQLDNAEDPATGRTHLDLPELLKARDEVINLSASLSPMATFDRDRVGIIRLVELVKTGCHLLTRIDRCQRSSSVYGRYRSRLKLVRSELWSVRNWIDAAADVVARPATLQSAPDKTIQPPTPQEPAEPGATSCKKDGRQKERTPEENRFCAAFAAEFRAAKHEGGAANPQRFAKRLELDSEQASSLIAVAEHFGIESSRAKSLLADTRRSARGEQSTASANVS